ncbi:leukotriene B4 receptor 1-like [Conger conger]|uniref:leukotriene B4 receptor 1-like n=1 Tax=Conger conger TaxID=82655 RepID=UPI002A5A0491|nr:leukotriene B4 receptor 1-like [Conger conger]
MQHLNISSHNSTSWNTKDVATSVVLGLCCVVGIPGNLLVVVAISRHLRKASLMVKLMLNLALTDILSLLMVPLWIVALLEGWPYGHAACKILSYAIYCGLYASVLTITLMSIHRYLKVLRPFCKARLQLGGRDERVLLASLWAMACFLAIPAAILRKVEEAGSGRPACIPHFHSHLEEATILLLETLLGFLVPGVILTASYLCIIHRVGRSPVLSSHRLNQLVTWVVVAFFLFWAPWHALNLVQAAATFVEGERPGREVGARLRKAIRQGHNVAGALTFLNSSLNPFLYAFASRSLRNGSSLLKRMERVCHPKFPDKPEPDRRRAVLGISSIDITLATTAELRPMQPASSLSSELKPRCVPDTQKSSL